MPKYVNPSDFLYGKAAYQRYIENKRKLDELEQEEVEPQIASLRNRLIAKRDQLEEVVVKAKRIYLIFC